MILEFIKEYWPVAAVVVFLYFMYTPAWKRDADLRNKKNQK